MADRPVAALSALVCAVAAITVATSPAVAETFPSAGSVPPDQDPFYAAPANIASYARARSSRHAR